MHASSRPSFAIAVAVALVVVSRGDARAQQQAADESREEVPRASFLSRSPLLFDPLLADPRWPHFSAAWQSYHASDSQLESVGAVSFGESFTFYRAPLFGAAIDIGFQASVFAIFDMEQESLDLVNADYLAGPVIAVRDGRWSGLLRLIHESSHLGDEYLLSHPTVERVNLSYETVDGLLAWQPIDAVRVYGGAGYIVHSDTELDRWLVHAGAEWLAPPSWGGVRPVAALDVQSRQYTDWTADVSVRAGVQFQDTEGVRGRVQLMVEYYRGSSPNGQFFVDEVEFVGVGLHFYF